MSATDAAGVCERAGDGYRLAPHMATLLLDQSSPAYTGGVINVLEQHEMFGRFEASLASGARMWWADTSPEWIASVSVTGTPFYTRLVPGGLQQVPGLNERLAGGGVIVDSACGAGVGLVRLAAHYPDSRLVGVDGDPHLAAAGEDVDGVVVAVPELVPETPDERRRYTAAQARRRLRLDERTAEAAATAASRETDR